MYIYIFNFLDCHNGVLIINYHEYKKKFKKINFYTIFI